MGRQLLQVAAAIGRAFTFELLHLTSGRGEEETLNTLDELLARGLLIEQKSEASYDYSHHKLRDWVIETMSLVRRRLLHRRLAELLEQQGRRLAQPALLAGQIARHYQLAGQNEDAAAYYVQAGDYAHTLFAHRESLAHYQTALALGHPSAAGLQENCGDLFIRLGQYGEALRAYEQASARAPLADLPRLEHKVGQVYLRRGDWELALHRFALAEQGWGDAAASQLYLDWSYTVYRQGDIAAASRLAQTAQQRATDVIAQANSHNILGILARRQGNTGEAHDHFQASRKLSQQHNLLDAHIAALNNLALLAAADENYLNGQALLETALDLCLTWGDRHWQAALHNNLADLFHRMGQEDVAMTQLKQSVTIYAELGRDGEMWQPEVWKLTEW